MTAGYGYKSTIIAKLIMQETGTYNQQWRRSFESNLTGDIQSRIIENCQKTGHITPGLLTGIANQFIKPSAVPERPIGIINGWDSRRFRFFMEIHSQSYMGSVIIQYVTGYTDHMGATSTGNIDPEMRFYINTVNTTKSSIRNTPLGAQSVQSIMDCSHLLYKNEYNGVFSTDHQHKMRPEDVFASMQNSELLNSDSEYNQNNTFIDTRSYLTTNPVKAARRYNSSPVFVASILDSYVQTKRADITGASGLEIYDTAAAHVSSARTNEDPFIKMLLNHTGSGGSFKYSDLLRIDPDIYQKIVISPLTPALRATLHQVGQTSQWQSSDYETQFATTLSQAVPGYMLDNSLQSVKFRATNDQPGGEIIVVLTNYNTLMVGFDPTPQLAAFTFTLQKTLLMDLTFNNQISFSLDMSCNLTGDTVINLSLNGGPQIPYVTPCFCDSLTSPLITSDLNKLNSLAHDLCSVVDYLGDASDVSNFTDNKNNSYI